MQFDHHIYIIIYISEAGPNVLSFSKNVNFTFTLLFNPANRYEMLNHPNFALIFHLCQPQEKFFICFKSQVLRVI